MTFVLQIVVPAVLSTGHLKMDLHQMICDVSQSCILKQFSEEILVRKRSKKANLLF
jgi:hypothetical protein